jgi:hypothetical protein
MSNILQSAFAKREIYFHEDDYCQQELLPREALSFAEAQVKQIAEFGNAHLAPDGIGWTDIYMRKEPPVGFRRLGMKKEEFESAVSSHLPPFDLVYTGYNSYRERCRKAAAWGMAESNALFADWDDDGIIKNVWAQFFDPDEKSLLAASKAVVALGMFHSIIYVDWAWGYTCEIINEEAFVSPLRNKLTDIAERTKKVSEGS